MVNRTRNSKNMKEIKMKGKIVATICIILVMIIFNSVYGQMQGPIEAEIAIKQLEDSATIYAVSRSVAQGVIPKLFNLTAFAILGYMWLCYILDKIKGEM